MTRHRHRQFLKELRGNWHELPGRFSEIHLDEFIIMPNHVHGIVSIVGAPLVGARISEEDRAGTRPAPTLGDIIGVFKSITTHSYTEGDNSNGNDFRTKLPPLSIFFSND